MNKNRPGVSSIVLTVVFALSSFGLLLFLWTSFGGPVPLRPQPYQVHVSFRQGSQLASYADVRISGVTVGKATKIVRGDGAADVTLAIEPAFAPLPRDTRATLRSKTLLGETFVALSFGSRRRAGDTIPEGGRIPSRQVDTAAEIDQILGVFDPATRRDLRRLLIAAAAGTRDRGHAFNQAAGELGPSVASTDGILGQLDRQRGDLRSGVADLSRAFGALGDEDGAVRRLITGSRQVLETTAGSAGPLRRTARALPELLRQTRATLRVARATAGDAAPTLRALRPVTPLIRPTLDDLNAIAPRLATVMRRLRPTLALAPGGLRALRSIVGAAGPVVDALLPALRDAVPVAQYLDLYRRELFVNFFNIASATGATTRNAKGGQSHYLRVYVPLNSELIAGATRVNPSTRANAYPLPGSLEGQATGGYAASTCDNVGNPAPLLAIPDVQAGPDCRVQGPLTFRGRSERFPRLLAEPDGLGG